MVEETATGFRLINSRIILISQLIRQLRCLRPWSEVGSLNNVTDESVV